MSNANDPLLGAQVLVGEQTNRSVLLPNLIMPDAPNGVIIKVLRYPAPVPHPDVEVPVALRQVGYFGVPKVLGFTTALLPDGDTITTSITSELIVNAVDGFKLACEYANRDESFAFPAQQLGATIAELHRALVSAFPESNNENIRELTAILRDRAETAVTEVPELVEFRDAILDEYDKLTWQGDLQRVHGDLHLGQTLLSSTDGQWYVLDFEGEPLRPAEDRARPDFPERDVAGMVRSFAYAQAVGGGSENWATEAVQAFQKGYAKHRALNENLLNALVLDKALYEAVYEKRHRPDWLHIPSAAITQMLGGIR